MRFWFSIVIQECLNRDSCPILTKINPAVFSLMNIPMNQNCRF